MICTTAKTSALYIEAFCVPVHVQWGSFDHTRIIKTPPTIYRVLIIWVSPLLRQMGYQLTLQASTRRDDIFEIVTFPLINQAILTNGQPRITDDSGAAISLGTEETAGLTIGSGFLCTPYGKRQISVLTSHFSKHDHHDVAGLYGYCLATGISENVDEIELRRSVIVWQDHHQII